jgi:hypothetical protein
VSRSRRLSRSLGFSRWARGIAVVLVAAVAAVAVSLFGAASGSVQQRSSTPQLEPAVPPASEELASERSAFSRTYRREDGARRTVIFATPVNYRDGQGDWQPIDTRLVADGPDRLQTAGSSVPVTAPKDLSDGEVRVGDDERWIAFTLDGASGSAAVSGSTATYEDAVGTTDAVMTATATGVKETLTIQDASAPAQYRYDLSASDGLTARLRADGAAVIVDNDDRERFVIPAPTVQEAGGQPTTDHVRFSLSSDGSRLTVSVDPQWLADAQLPVQVDPTVYDGAAVTACNLASGSLASTSDCSSGLLKAGYDGTRTRRFALRWTSLVSNNIPVGAAIDYAQMGLTYESKTSSTAHPQIDVAALGHSVAAGATWNTYNGSAAWSTAGGDLDTSAGQVQPLPWGDNFQGDPQEPLGWDVSGLVQSWLRDPTTNHGVLVRAHDESVSNVMSFDSPTGTHQGPYLAIDWRTRPGRESGQTLEAQTESTTSQLAVNVVSGNLNVSGADVHLPGVGRLDLDVRRDYNSGDFADQHLAGSAWGVTVNNASLDLETHFLSQGHTLVANGGAIYRFDRDTAADTTVGGVLHYGYKTPPNFDGTMRQSSATGVTTVTFPGGTTWTYKDGNFFGQVLTKITDAAGHHIDLTYDPLWGSDGQALTKITDTNGHDLTVSRTSPAGTVTGLTDTSTGHHWTWSVDSADHHNLDGVTDPDGNTQTYTYTTTIPTVWDQLKKVTTGTRQTTITYGNGSTARADQVTSISTVVGSAAAVTTTFNYNPSSGTGHACDPTVANSPYADNHTVGRTVETDSASRVTTYCYNKDGQVIQTWRPWDTTAPAATPTFGWLDARNGAVSGQGLHPVALAASDGQSGVKKLSWVEGSTVLASASAACEPQATLPQLCPSSYAATVSVDTAPMAEGVHTLHQVSIDLAGNASDGATSTVRIDRSAPSAPTDFDASFDPDSSVTDVSWAPAPDPNLADGSPGSGTGSYRYRISRSGGAWSAWQTIDDMDVLLSGSAVGETITLEVKPIDLVGNEGASALATLVSATPSLDYDGPDVDDGSDPADAPVEWEPDVLVDQDGTEYPREGSGGSLVQPMAAYTEILCQSSPTCGSYDGHAAAMYARHWFNVTNSDERNKNYAYFGGNGGDCTNFASQALKAGGMRFMGAEGYNDPNGTPTSTFTPSWHREAGSWFSYWTAGVPYRDYHPTGSFIRAQELHHHLVNYGLAVNVSHSARPKPGDIVFYSAKHHSTDVVSVDNLGHTQVVTRVTSNTKAGVYVAQHSKAYEKPITASFNAMRESYGSHASGGWEYYILRPVYTAANLP